jgi:hypothetical protein
VALEFDFHENEFIVVDISHIVFDTGAARVRLLTMSHRLDGRSSDFQAAPAAD